MQSIIEITIKLFRL